MFKSITKKVFNEKNIPHLSKMFLPMQVLPKDSFRKIKDHETHSKSSRLMLELGIIKQCSMGCFHLLPFGIRSLEKLVKIIDKEMHRIGGQKIEFPTLINEKLWKTSGRLNEINELFKLSDRQEHKYILGPTHEEVATELISQSQNSYKQFPLLLYQITNKFRDELKPRLGLLRSKQFIMKDMYSFDIDYESAMDTYESVNESYKAFFDNLGLECHKVEGNAGIMGGSLSHEYHLMSEVGEDTFLKCHKCNNSFNVDLIGGETCPVCKGDMNKFKGIEVGHTFFLGTRYSKPFNCHYITKNGEKNNLQMCSFGLGLTRIIAASLEKLSTDEELRWPRHIVPYSVLIILPKMGSKEEMIAADLITPLCSSLYDLEKLKDDILIDDCTDSTIGKRFVQAKRLGYSFIILLGGTIKEEPIKYELYDTIKEEHLYLNFEDLICYINKSL